MKRLIMTLAALAMISMAMPASAGIPVIDSANLAQAVQQVASWIRQAQQMTDLYEKSKEQIDQLKKELDAMTGDRGMANLAPMLRNYLPADLANMKSVGTGNWRTKLEELTKFNVEDETPLDGGSDTLVAWRDENKQAAIRQAFAESAYNESSRRFTDIQTLMSKISAAKDPKDIQDLQARIQAEQVMILNESNKLMAMQMAAEADRDAQLRRLIQLRMQSGIKPMPAGY